MGEDRRRETAVERGYSSQRRRRLKFESSLKCAFLPSTLLVTEQTPSAVKRAVSAGGDSCH